MSQEPTGGPEGASSRRVGVFGIAHTSLSRIPALYDDQTFRTVIRSTLQGNACHVRVSNRYGLHPVRIGGGGVSVCTEDGTLLSAPVPLAFSGKSFAILEPGTDLSSDAAVLDIPLDAWLAIDLYYPDRGRFRSGNIFPLQHRASESGNHVGERAFPERVSRFRARGLEKRVLPKPIGVFSGVDVLTPPDAGAIVAFGDSITALNQWTGPFSEFLRKEMPGKLSLLNAGISGNRLGHDSWRPATGGFHGPAGILRFEKDVLAHHGVAVIIALIGINDLLQPGLTAPRDEETDAESLIDGLRALIMMAHQEDIPIWGGTITPFGGFLMTHTPEREAVRQAVNTWIRQSNEFDAFIDFDLAVRDPVSPERLTSSWHIGDRLHPNAAGGRAMSLVASQLIPDRLGSPVPLTDRRF